jgi:hypothetical protein
MGQSHRGALLSAVTMLTPSSPQGWKRAKEAKVSWDEWFVLGMLIGAIAVFSLHKGIMWAEREQLQLAKEMDWSVARFLEWKAKEPR